MPILLGFLPIVLLAMLDIVFRENLFVLGLLSSAHRAPCLAKLAGAD
jgi:hypothetical protein